MNPEIRQEWVDALRSDEYKQGSGFLHEGDNWCCLGVLCDRAVRHGVIPQPRLLGPSDHGGSADARVYSYGTDAGEDFGRSYTSLPAAVVEWAGLPDENPEVNAPAPFLDEDDPTATAHQALSDLNDSGESFATIAELIESSL